MNRPSRPGRHLGLLLLPCLVVVLAPLALAGPKKERLIPANLRPKTDSKGYRWDLSRQGYINNGTNYCFNRAMVLSVNGSEFHSRRAAMMTPDGSEFVFNATVRSVQVTRRVRIDNAFGAARFTEVFKNTSRRRITITIRHYTRLSRTCESVTSNTGRRIYGAKLDKKEYGILCYQRNRYYPSVVFCLSSPNGRVKPSIQVQSNRTLNFNYVLTIKPGKSAAISVTIVQRKYSTKPATKQLLTELKPYSQKKWLQTLPRHIRKLVANYGGALAVAEEEAGSPLAELNALIEAFDADELDKQAALFLSEDSKILGKVTGSPIRVKGPFGSVEVPFSQVAAVRGGAGKGRPMSLYLRNGEILSGQLAASGLAMTTKVGLDVKLDLKSVDALFLTRSKTDGKLDRKQVKGVLRTHDGNKLLLTGLPGTFSGSSPWGVLRVGLDQIRNLSYRSEPYPGLWLTLLDSSYFPIAPHGGDLKLKTLRFGDLSLHPSALAGMRAVGKLPPTPFVDSGEVKTTHCFLLGSSRLVGDIALKALEVVLQTGDTTTVQVAQIKTMEQTEVEGGQPRFEVTLFSGESFTGGIRQRVIPIKTARGVRHLPAGHLVKVRRAKPKPVAPKPDPKKDPTDPKKDPTDPKKDPTDPKKDPKKDPPKKVSPKKNPKPTSKPAPKDF